MVTTHIAERHAESSEQGGITHLRSIDVVQIALMIVILFFSVVANERAKERIQRDRTKMVPASVDTHVAPETKFDAELW